MAKKKKKLKLPVNQPLTKPISGSKPIENWAMKVSVAGWIVFLICLLIAVVLMFSTIPKGDTVPLKWFAEWINGGASQQPKSIEEMYGVDKTISTALTLLACLQWTGAIAALVAIGALFLAKKDNELASSKIQKP